MVRNKDAAPNTIALAAGDAAEPSPSGQLERVLALLELLAGQPTGLPLSEIADGLNIPRSATHRLLTGLADHGYVRQHRGGGDYQLTAKIVSLAFRFLGGLGVTDLAQPILERLARESRELVRLSLIDGDRLTWVAKAQGETHGLRYDPEMGQEARLSCSASGIAWLSRLPEAEALALVHRQGFGARKDFGPNAPESDEELLVFLRGARARGYAQTIHTFSDWMSTIAAPIASATTRQVIGAVNIAGPSFRLTETRMAELAPALLKAADELSIALAARAAAIG